MQPSLGKLPGANVIRTQWLGNRSARIWTAILPLLRKTRSESSRYTTSTVPEPLRATCLSDAILDLVGVCHAVLAGPTVRDPVMPEKITQRLLSADTEGQTASEGHYVRA